jgi:hypothetical protein
MDGVGCTRVERERLNLARAGIETYELRFEWLADGETLTNWLDGFPGVTREQALRVLEDAKAGECKLVGAVP